MILRRQVVQLFFSYFCLSVVCRLCEQGFAIVSSMTTCSGYEFRMSNTHVLRFRAGGKYISKAKRKYVLSLRFRLEITVHVHDYFVATCPPLVMHTRDHMRTGRCGVDEARQGQS